MGSPEVLAEIDGSDPRHQKIADLCIALERAAREFCEDEDPLEASAMILTAGAVLSGAMFGRLVISGAASDKDTRRAREGAAANFRSGIGIGKRAALRALTEQMGGNA